MKHRENNGLERTIRRLSTSGMFPGFGLLVKCFTSSAPIMGLESNDIDRSNVAGHGRSISSKIWDSSVESASEVDRTNGVSSLASTSAVLLERIFNRVVAVFCEILLS